MTVMKTSIQHCRIGDLHSLNQPVVLERNALLTCNTALFELVAVSENIVHFSLMLCISTFLYQYNHVLCCRMPTTPTRTVKSIVSFSFRLCLLFTIYFD
jgi:hypothetical protein